MINMYDEKHGKRRRKVGVSTYHTRSGKLWLEIWKQVVFRFENAAFGPVKGDPLLRWIQNITTQNLYFYGGHFLISHLESVLILHSSLHGILKLF